MHVSAFNPRMARKEYLTIEELRTLMATDSYRPEVKEAFIFACFTGLRLSDMYRLAPMHIFKTADGKGEYIDMEMQKTEKPVIIPLSEEAKRWLPKPRGNDIPFFDIPTTHRYRQGSPQMGGSGRDREAYLIPLLTAHVRNDDAHARCRPFYHKAS